MYEQHLQVGELIYNTWHRRAPQCHFSLIPMPIEPFALPTDDHSDPLRCPIYVPLNVAAAALTTTTDTTQLSTVRHEILGRFGFIPLTCPLHTYVPVVVIKIIQCCTVVYYIRTPRSVTHEQ